MRSKCSRPKRINFCHCRAAGSSVTERQPSAAAFDQDSRTDRTASDRQLQSLRAWYICLKPSSECLYTTTIEVPASRFWPPLRLAVQIFDGFVRAGLDNAFVRTIHTDGKLPTVYPRRLHVPKAFISCLIMPLGDPLAQRHSLQDLVRYQGPGNTAP
jgi:hypothetical protein